MKIQRQIISGGRVFYFGIYSAPNYKSVTDALVDFSDSVSKVEGYRINITNIYFKRDCFYRVIGFSLIL